jgi:hypothetical protein
MATLLTIAVPRRTRRTPRRKALDALYMSQYGDLSAVMFDHEPALNFGDGASVLRLLADAIPRYRGEPEREAFRKWATRFVQKEARRFVLAHEILRTQRKLIKFTVYYAMKSDSCQDWAVTNEDIESEVAMLVFRYALLLSNKGTAKLSTRLRALIERHCGFCMKKRRRRLEIVTTYETTIGAHGCETLSPDELAEIIAEEMEEAA